MERPHPPDFVPLKSAPVATRSDQGCSADRLASLDHFRDKRLPIIPSCVRACESGCDLSWVGRCAVTGDFFDVNTIKDGSGLTAIAPNLICRISRLPP